MTPERADHPQPFRFGFVVGLVVWPAVSAVAALVALLMLLVGSKSEFPLRVLAGVIGPGLFAWLLVAFVSGIVGRYSRPERGRSRSVAVAAMLTLVTLPFLYWIPAIPALFGT